MISFTGPIEKIGINPYVEVPPPVLQQLFTAAKKDTGPIAITLLVGKKEFTQHVVRYSGKWRLYLNTPMRQAAGRDVGDSIRIRLVFNPEPPVTMLHPLLEQALAKNKKAAAVFHQLTPSYRKEIMRYINNLKTQDAIERNCEKAVQHLLGKQRFVGRD